MCKPFLFTFSLFFIFSFISFGQNRQEIEDDYKDANAYYYFEDYDEALALYLKIYDHYSNNSNLDYRIGLCYLNVSGQRSKAIPFLERAAKNTSKRYNENSLKETNAPLDALFYLGNAYFYNNQLDKALEAYEAFKVHIRNERRYDMEYFNHQINAIKRSKTVQKYPVNFLRSNLGANINNRFPNFNPTISGDGKTMAYTTKERFYQAVQVVRKEGDSWGRPRNITLDLIVNGNCSTLSLSYDGTELYLFKDDNHVGNIYVTNFKDGSWTPMRKLNENINTESYETHACISPDGKKLYFSSNRTGGFGDLDIYVSNKNSKGDWGPAINLGPNINTRFNENTPFITSDGKTLFFSSEGHSGVGGYDIVFSQLQTDGSWSKPVNLGFPINTSDDNLFYQPIGDGSIGLMALLDPNGFGETDITQIEIFLPKYQKSIVTSNDFYNRKAELPTKTLIIDTVNVSGVALLDPTKSAHRSYLDTELQYTLFFDGKPYELRDQSAFTTAPTSLLANKSSSEIDKQAVITNPIDEKNQKQPDPEINDDLNNIPIEQRVGENERTIAIVSGRVDSVRVDNIPSSNQKSNLLPKEDNKSLDRIKLEDILAIIADSEMKSIISELFPHGITSTNLSLKDQLNLLYNTCDSLHKTEDLVALFAKLNDIIGIRVVEGQYRQSRSISQTSYDEDFFYRLQKLKRKAPVALAELFDDAILTQPQISSFYSLWQYLNTSKQEQIKPFMKELLTLLMESGINDFSALSVDEKEQIVQKLSQKPKTFNGFLIAIIVLIGIVILWFLFIRLKRNKKGA